MFRRRMSELVVYDVYINKGMLPGQVSIEVDGNIVSEGFDGDHIRLSFSLPVSNISVRGDVVQKDPVYEENKLMGSFEGVISGTVTLPQNSGVACGKLAKYVQYANVTSTFSPVTSVDPGDRRKVYFKYSTSQRISNAMRYPVKWIGTPVVDTNCVDTVVDPGSYPVRGTDSYSNHTVMVVIAASG